MVDAMSQELTLFSRQGCCLCEGLEQRLRSIDLTGLGLRMTVVDIDAPGTHPAVKARFDLDVPVLSLAGRLLPRVSPRLSGDGLFVWLQRALSSESGTT